MEDVESPEIGSHLIHYNCTYIKASCKSSGEIFSTNKAEQLNSPMKKSWISNSTKHQT